jgi:hypothetical protein
MDIYRENVKVPEVEQANSFALNSYPQGQQSYPQDKSYPQKLSTMCRGWGTYPQPVENYPRVLSITTVCIILPNKKYTLK